MEGAGGGGGNFSPHPTFNFDKKKEVCGGGGMVHSYTSG